MTKQRGFITLSGPAFMAIVVISFSTCALLQPKPEEPANAPSVKLESGKAG